MSLSVELIRCATQLTEQDIAVWNRLARNPLQRWEWLGSWWEAFQSRYEFYVLRVRQDDTVVGFVPWCIENRLTTGRTIQFLASGKACSDHLSLIVRPEQTEAVCIAVTNWLLGERSGAEIWDTIELIGVDRDDHPINQLACVMREQGLDVQQTDGMGCYAIDLPYTWDAYVQMRSKSGRREIRHSLKHIDDRTIIVERVQNEQQLEQIWDSFVSLHQRRRHASGTTGCFDYPGFESFLRTAASRLLEAGLLELVIASSDGTAVAAHFALVDQRTWYFYQSGMDPDVSDLRPGLSVFCYAIRETIQTGRTRFDMMRGDEPYKLRWRAELLPAQEIRVCSPRKTAQLRNQVYQAGLSFKNLLKSGLGIGQPQS